MTLATRCTHCGTIFKVVQDQLKVSEGWVRCGRCQQVFHALPTLFDLEHEPPPPRPVTAMPPAPAETPPPPFEAPPAPPEPVPAYAPEAEAPPPAWVRTQPQTPLDMPASLPPPPESGGADGLARPAEAPQAEPTAQPPSTDLPSRVPDELLDAPPANWRVPAAPVSAPPASQPVPGQPERPLTAADLALDPPAIEAATDFELDTGVDTGFGAPAPQQAGSPAPLSAPQARSGPDAPLEAWDEASLDTLPTTDESDALDSRYLMPTDRDRKTPRRRRGPEFADAQFPSDALEDLDDDWVSDFGASSLEDEGRQPAPAPTSPLAKAAAAVAAVVPGLGARQTGAATPAAASGAPSSSPSSSPSSPPPVPPQANATTATPLDARPSQPPAQPIATPATPSTPPADELSTLPSRFAEDDARPSTDFRPELSLEPPSRRKGRPGTRGRDPAQRTPEFMRRAQRKAFWRHPATRGVLALLLISLVATLGLQVATRFRNVIAAYVPASQPVLALWCQTAGCALHAPLRIDAMQVESATLVRASSEGTDHYRLSVVIHNAAPVDVAWPSVDLTLTDTNGQVIARRVFSPDDAQWLDTSDPRADLPSDTTMAAQAAASTPTAAPRLRSTTLQWRLVAPDLQPAGYTAELFYP